MKSRKLSRKQNSLFIVSILLTALLALLIVFWVCGYFRCGLGIEKTDIDELAKQIAINEYLNLTKFFASLIMGVMGALWVLFFSSHRKIVPMRWFESLLLFDTVAGLGIALFCYFRHSDTIVRRAFAIGAIELDAPLIEFWFGWQRRFFYFSIISFLALLIYLFIKLNKKERNNN